MSTTVDLVLRNATLYDGSGDPPRRGDLAIDGDAIVAVGDVAGRTGRQEIDVGGLAVAPGFINMLSWAVESLIADGRSQSDIRQGVTLEVVGESFSWGPLNDALKAYLKQSQTNIQYDIVWDTLGEYLDHLAARGIACNIASFVGAAGVRANVLGFDDRQPGATELAAMQGLVAQAMEEGAVGISTALIYPPGSYATTDELIALVQVVADHDGLYISHLRSEGDSLEAGLEEFLTILRATGCDGEIYHLKIAGQDNWHKLEWLIDTVEAARAEGLQVTADMYTYNAGGTGLNSVVPPWHHDGGTEALLARLRDPETRRTIIDEMRHSREGWENLYRAVGGADGILLVDFRNPAFRDQIGRTLGDIARERGTPPEDTALDLLLENQGQVSAIYFMIDEENIRRQVQLPWVSFCSDSESAAPEGVFLEASTHPRAFGSFARLLGQFVRDEQLLPLEEAIRRLTSFPAETLKLRRRGRLAPGHYADVVVFDPARVRHNATYTAPQQYADGMVHVFVNGTQVLADGDHTGALPGRVVRGPGWRGWQNGRG